MTCILGTDKNGNRFIACTRRERPKMNDDFAEIVHPESPWRVGTKVKHKHYGEGKIIARGQEYIDIDFYDNGVKRFVIMYINKNIEVLK